MNFKTLSAADAASLFPQLESAVYDDGEVNLQDPPERIQIQLMEGASLGRAQVFALPAFWSADGTITVKAVGLHNLEEIGDDSMDLEGCGTAGASIYRKTSPGPCAALLQVWRDSGAQLSTLLLVDKMPAEVETSSGADQDENEDEDEGDSSDEQARAELFAGAHPGQAGTRGVVELIRISDENYVEIYIDGAHYESVHKNCSASSSVLSRSFARDFKINTGFSISTATFVEVAFFDDRYSKGLSIDISDFPDGDYQPFLDELAANGPMSKNNVRILGVGIEMAEAEIVYRFR